MEDLLDVLEMLLETLIISGKILDDLGVLEDHLLNVHDGLFAQGLFEYFRVIVLLMVSFSVGSFLVIGLRNV